MPTKPPTKKKTINRTPGRPSKITKKVQDSFRQALLAGSHIKTAAEYAGISYSTVRNWINRGEIVLDACNGEITPEHPEYDYVEFLEVTKKAIAQSEVVLTTRAFNGSKDDPRIALKVLERRFPDRWANTQIIRVEVQKEFAAFYDHLERRLPPHIFRQVLQAAADVDGGSPEPFEGADVTSRN